MGNKIRINCRKVFDNGVFYENKGEEIKEIQKELDKISVEINEIWDGVDGNNFCSSFNDHIKNLDQIINFLNANGDLLKKNALEHSSIDNDFAIKMERSDINEL